MAYRMQFDPIIAAAPQLLQGAINTLSLSAQSIACGVTIGLVAAVARVEGPNWLNRFVGVYVEVFRNTPLLVQLFLIYFGLPYIGIRLLRQRRRDLRDLAQSWRLFHGDHPRGAGRHPQDPDRGRLGAGHVAP